MSLLNLTSPAGQSPRGKKSLKMWMGAGLVVAVLGIGSTFAANINLNSNGNSEFGQGVTATVYCGASEENVIITPLSKYVNATSELRQIAAAQAAIPAVSYTYRFATSVNTSNTSDFIASNQATKVVNGRTGVWLTDSGSNGQIASNQDQTTFSSSNRSSYVFSQNATTKRINNADVRGFYKVNNTTTETIVIAPAVSARAAQMQTFSTPASFKVRGVKISKIPSNCSGKNFIVSGYASNGGEALTLVDDGEGTVTEVAALWNGDGAVRVSSQRDYYQPNSNLSATQTSTELIINFIPATSQLLPADDLARLVLETQENTLNLNGNNEEDDD
jgi:hypothetical protein